MMRRLIPISVLILSAMPLAGCNIGASPGVLPRTDIPPPPSVTSRDSRGKIAASDAARFHPACRHRAEHALDTAPAVERRYSHDDRQRRRRRLQVLKNTSERLFENVGKLEAEISRLRNAAIDPDNVERSVST